MSTELPASPALPPDAAPTPSPSPFSPRGVCQLFFKPRAFFGDAGRMARPIEFLVAVYLIGVLGVMERVDQRLLKSMITGRESDVPTDGFITMMLDGWGPYWGVVLGGGVLAAALSWLIQGWFYVLRLRWSGAADVDPTAARRVWAFQAMVFVLPVIALSVMQTAMYGNYRAAWNAQEFWSGVVPLVCVFWSCWTSYVGATTSFSLHRWKGRLWFLILPLVFYLCIFFGVAVATVTAMTQAGG